MSNRTLSILSALIVIQAGLALALAYSGHNHGAFRTSEKLLGLDASIVDKIVIAEQNRPPLLLQKTDGTWLLPEHDRFPASGARVKQLTGTLAGLTRSWPVATTTAAAKRFKVSPDEYERKIAFMQGDKTLTTLFLGTSPGFRKVNARVAGQDEIYAIRFNNYQASGKAEDWEDKDYLKVKAGDIGRVEMPDLTLERKDEKWRLAGLADNEETDVSEADKLIRQIAGLSFQSVLGTKDEPRYRQDKPALRFTIALQGGKRITYTYSQPKDEDYYVLKTSTHPFFFKTAKFSLDNLREITRDKLVRTREKTPSPEAGDNNKKSPTSAQSG